MKNQNYKLTIKSEEGTEVLYRVLNLFLRRKIKVAEVKLTPQDDHHLIEIAVDSNNEGIETIIKQLYRIIGITNITQ